MPELFASLSELLTEVPGIVTMVAALGGAVVGALSTLLVTWINNRSAERRHVKELVFTAATENWKKTIEVAAEQPGKHAIAPLDDFIVGLIATADLFFGRRVTKANVQELLEEADILSEKINEWRFKKLRQARESGM